MLKQMASGNPDETYEPMPMRARVPGARRHGSRCSTSSTSTGRCSTRRRWRCRSSSTWSTRRSRTPTSIRSTVGSTRPGTSTVSTSRRPRCMSLRDLDRSVAELEHVLDRGARIVLFPTGPAGGRSPGDPYFDPDLGTAARGRGRRRVPHHGALVQRAPRAGVGSRPGAGAVAHVGLAVAEHLRRAPDRGHALGADLRQRVRPLPEPDGAGVGVRRVVGAALRRAHGQEPGDGPQRARGSAGRCASDRARSSAVTCASRPTPKTTW